MFHVVEEKSKPNGVTQMTVVLEGDNPEELRSANTRNEVLKIAREKGFPAKGIGGTPNSYPVDEKGETDDALALGGRPVKAWRADFLVTSGVA